MRWPLRAAHRDAVANAFEISQVGRVEFSRTTPLTWSRAFESKATNPKQRKQRVKTAKHDVASGTSLKEWHMASKKSLIPVEQIEHSILMIQGLKVILDKDLAALYGVTTGNLNKAVDRNVDRFPADFMIRLTQDDFNNLKFHFGRSSWGGTRKLPRAFTEQGVAMLSGILNSPRAILVNIEIMRAFVRLRSILTSNEALAKKLAALESKYDAQFKVVFDAIRELMSPPAPKTKRAIGLVRRDTK